MSAATVPTFLGLTTDELEQAGPDTYVDLNGRTFRVLHELGSFVYRVIPPSGSCFGCDGSGRSVWASTRGRPCICMDHVLGCDPDGCEPFCPSFDD